MSLIHKILISWILLLEIHFVASYMKERICQGRVRSLSCNKGTMVIHEAYFGRQSKYYCWNRNFGGIWNTSCKKDVTKIISEICDNKKYCVVSATREGLSQYYNTCPYTSKYLFIKRSCWNKVIKKPIIDYCQINNTCDQVCKNGPNGVICSCFSGYTYNYTSKKCEDVDECKNATLNTCDRNTTKCENTPGDFQCNCLSGLEHVGGKKSSCKDIDECQNEKGGCQYFCTNTYRSYYCSCKNNTVLDNNNHRCNDIDECSTGKHECEQECRNNYGGYFCRCNDGFNLNKDKKTCSDENECLPNGGKGVCEFKCNNTIGSYYCSCDTGYVLHNDKRTCRDFDECKARIDECDTAVSTCENNFGSYNCRCHTGYLKNSKGICVAKKCPALKPTQNGQIYPPNCMLPNTKQYKDVCNFKCDKGYELDESSAEKASCSEFGYWDLGGKFQPNCRPTE